MAKLINVFRGTMVAVEVEGVTLVVDERIRYLTIDKIGAVHGWGDCPYYDEKYGEWDSCSGGVCELLAIITPPENPEKLYEVYG